MPWLRRSLVENQQGDFNDIGTAKQLHQQAAGTQPVAPEPGINSLYPPTAHDMSTAEGPGKVCPG
jgi:hypothetical protein